MKFRISSTVRRTATLIVLGAAALAPGLAGATDTWPSKPVTVINPWASGGPAEAIIRPIAEKLGQRLGQPFIVESKSGANGTIGAAHVAKSKPDGYTLLFSHVGPIAIMPALPNKPPYDSVKDFTPITQLVSGPTVLVVRSDFPASTLQELVAYAKANPGKVAYGSVGIGSSTHMAGATLAQLSGTEMIHVPYRGSGQINTDLLGGQIQMAFVNVAGVMGLIQDQKLKPLAVSTTRRTAVLPDVPAVAEVYTGFEVNSWYGLMAPAGTPEPIIAKLHDEVVEILKMSDILKRIKDNGLDVEGTTPQAYGEKIKGDLVRWEAAVKAAGITE